MREYQVKRLTSCKLPETVYRQALWAVKDLPRMKERLLELEEMLDCIPSSSVGEPRSYGGERTDQTARLAGQLAGLALRIERIEGSLMVIPPQYREGILGKLAYEIPYSDQFHLNTWKRWQQVYLYQVAMELHLY